MATEILNTIQNVILLTILGDYFAQKCRIWFLYFINFQGEAPVPQQVEF
jgi:hypothetical protein